MKSPVVSVVLPVFNAARTLRAAIESILTQTQGDLELIAIDDGSTDGSGALLDAFAAADARVRLIRRPNTGIVGALNDGLAAARAEFIARMDADDIAAPRRLERQLAHLHANPGCVALGSAVDLLDASGARVENLRRPLNHAANEAALLRGDGGTVIHPAACFRRDAIEAAGRYRAFAQYVEDLDLYVRLAPLGTIENLPDTLLGYRVHFSSINFTKNAGRHTVALQVLAEAHRVRGLPFDPATVADASAWSDPLAHHRRWAVTALPLSGRRTALKHGLAACRLAPFTRESWRCLRYALTAPIRSPAA